MGVMIPRDIEAERATLGCVLVDNASAFILAELVTPADFYEPRHQKIASAMLALVQESQPVDLLTLVAWLEGHGGQLASVGGLVALTGLAASIPSAANARHYAEIVRDRARQRRIMTAASKIGELVSAGGDAEAMADEAARLMFAATHGGAALRLEPIGAVAGRAFDAVERRAQNPGAVTGVATGLTDLDRMTAGLQPSELVILAARPSMGKTSLAMGIAEAAARSFCGGEQVLVFSLEMSKESLTQRMLGSMARINGTKLRAGLLAADDWMGLAHARKVLDGLPIRIADEASVSVMDVRAQCRQAAVSAPVGLVVVDYLQLMRGTVQERGGNREQEVAEISRGLKALAKELRCPVLALSQLNRTLESRAEKRPMMNDLRESGSIEQDADLITFIYRDEVYNPDSADRGVAELIIAKQRNGPIGVVRARFFQEYTRFENLA